jgi:putative membrane protein
MHTPNTPPQLPEPPGDFLGHQALTELLPRSPRRLNPMSPVVRAGRAVIGLVTILLITTEAGGSSKPGSSGGSPGHIIDFVLLGVAVVAGVVAWAVTTWLVDGDTLQVHSGLIRRRTVRVPLSRVQAVDVIEPLFARLLGLAEVRVRTAGGSDADARLMYLKAGEAYQVRAALLAVTHGLPDSTPSPPESAAFRVSNGRLVMSVLLTVTSVGVLISVAIFVTLSLLGSAGHAFIAANGGAALYLLAIGRAAFRRVAAEWDFEAAGAADGLRLRCGLLSKTAETIPYGRIQAVRMVEPLWWRPLGWYRLEIHLAGSARNKSNEPRRPVQRALLPVGSKEDAVRFLNWVLPDHGVALTRPPKRAMLRAPFSYHFLAAGRNASCAVSVSGRVRRLTEYAPLSKLQSIRSERGPVQRWLRIGSIHLDIAGRRASVRWLHRGTEEIDHLMGVLPLECEAARDVESAALAHNAALSRAASAGMPFGPGGHPSLPTPPPPPPGLSGGPFIGAVPNA